MNRVPNSSAQLASFVSFKISEKEIPADLLLYLQWFMALETIWKKEAKNVDDLLAIGMRFKASLPTPASDDDYKKALNQLVLFQTMMHREKMEGFLSPAEKNELQLQRISTESKHLAQSEKNHFLEETHHLGDQAEDIAGGSFRLASFTEEKKKKNKHAS